MTGQLHIVVTCTSRKRWPAPALLQLGSVQGTTVPARCAAWLAALEAVPCQRIPAQMLYAGDAWQIARALPGLVQDGRSELWVVSAGYGLVPAEAPLKPYAATLTPGGADSVVRHGDQGGRRALVQQWWECLATASGPAPGRPRSLAELAAADPDAAMMVVSSGAYLEALAEDLRVACGRLRSPEQLLVVSAGGRLEGELAAHLLPVDVRLQAVLGGSRQALNVRAARWLLQHTRGQLRLGEASRQLQRFRAQQPPAIVYQRMTLDDAQVRGLVRRFRREDPTLSRTQLLRRLRADGFACEQARFAAIWRSVIAEEELNDGAR